MKPPEFDSQSEVVLGQCEPFTPGWSLYLVDTEKKREYLITGTYTDLRHIQESCAALEEPEQIRKQVARLSSLLDASVTETLATGSSPPGSNDNNITKEMPPVTVNVPH